jgi:serine/threonine protein kinase
LAARNVLIRFGGVKQKSPNVNFECVLCDFGMSRMVSGDGSQKTTSDTFPLRWSGNAVTNKHTYKPNFNQTNNTYSEPNQTMRQTKPKIAPELLKERKISKQSDIYSFGMTCIEVFSRKLPFPDMKATDVAVGISSGTLRPQIPNECPSSFKEMLERCVSFETSERPSTKDVLTDLK